MDPLEGHKERAPYWNELHPELVPLRTRGKTKKYSSLHAIANRSKAKKTPPNPSLVPVASEPFKARLAALGFASYQAYLGSPHWRTFRAQYRECAFVLHRCFVCGADEYEIHHRSYDRLGHERFRDVIPLCRQCHQMTHTLLKSGGLTSLKTAATELQQMVRPQPPPLPQRKSAPIQDDAAARRGDSKAS